MTAHSDEEPTLEERRQWPTSEDFVPGSHLSGALYSTEALLGEGGFGRVYRMRSWNTGVQYAWKVLHQELSKDQNAVVAFEKESRRWLALGQHQHVVDCIGVGRIRGRLYIAMEYVPGFNGASTLAAVRPLDEKEVIRLAAQIAAGLCHAYTRGIRCHLDIKPSNVLLTAIGDAKVSDFGLAVANRSASAPTAPGNPAHTARFAAGTLPYMAPEQFGRLQDCDERADVYSLGLLTFQLLTGYPPFLFAVDTQERAFHAYRQAHFSSAVPRTGTTLDGIIARCAAKHPRDRYPTMAALLQDLLSLRDAQGVVVPSPKDKGILDWVAEGKGLLNLGDIAGALKCFNQALAHDPNNNAVLSLIGDTHMRLGNPKDALEHFERITNPSDWTLSQSSRALEQLGHYEEALACEFKAAVEAGHPANHYRIGTLARQLGMEPMARYHFAQCVIEEAAYVSKEHHIRRLALIRDMGLTLARNCLNNVFVFGVDEESIWPSLFDFGSAYGDWGDDEAFDLLSQFLQRATAFLGIGGPDDLGTRRSLEERIVLTKQVLDRRQNP